MSEILYLPPTAEGLVTIGDLWDSRSSSRVGFNLFGKSITKDGFTNENPQVIQIGPSGRTELYEFKHMKDSSASANEIRLGAEITCELLGGKVTTIK